MYWRSHFMCIERDLLIDGCWKNRRNTKYQNTIFAFAFCFMRRKTQQETGNFFQFSCDESLQWHCLSKANFEASTVNSDPQVLYNVLCLYVYDSNLQFAFSLLRNKWAAPYNYLWPCTFRLAHARLSPFCA